MEITLEALKNSVVHFDSIKRRNLFLALLRDNGFVVDNEIFNSLSQFYYCNKDGVVCSGIVDNVNIIRDTESDPIKILVPKFKVGEYVKYVDHDDNNKVYIYEVDCIVSGNNSYAYQLKNNNSSACILEKNIELPEPKYLLDYLIEKYEETDETLILLSDARRYIHLFGGTFVSRYTTIDFGCLTYDLYIDTETKLGLSIDTILAVKLDKGFDLRTYDNELLKVLWKRP